MVEVLKGIASNPPEPRDSSDQWLAEFLSKRIELDSMPDIASLESFSKQPLPVKIRVKGKSLRTWSLQPELQEKMFKVDNAAPCMAFKSLIFCKRVLRPYRSGTTASSFTSTWDFTFRNILEEVFLWGRTDRDTYKGISPRTQRPRFLFILDDVCVFRGEEKAPGTSISVPIEDLRSKLVWTYGSVPYVFGYGASGYKIDLIALRCENGVVTKAPIQSFDLAIKEDKFAVILAMLNLSLLIPALVEACPASGKAASPQPSSSGNHSSVEEHAPEMFDENVVHTTAVDIWAVGYLIETSDVLWLDFAQRSSLYERLMAEVPTARPSAEEALAALVAIEAAQKREQEAECEKQQGGQSRMQTRKRARPYEN